MKNSLLSFFSGLLTDISKVKSGKEKKEIIYVVGFSTWKTYLRKYFSEYKLFFLPKTISEKNFNYEFKKAILKNKKNCQVFIWGFKAPDYILSFLQENEISTKYVEDGFVRSVKLGATKAPPMSLCLDSVTPYFDATKESELEKLLNNFDFNKSEGILPRAKKGISLLRETGISKYNNSNFVNINNYYGIKNKKRILVIGQVEDDASILYGCEKKLSNNDLVRLAVKENPDSQVIYKPHPDVMNGHRPYQSNPEEVEGICYVLKEDIPLANSFETIDHVYTITSLAGFEALMRGIPVTTLGCPFYSGWGLTDDRQLNPRRKRKLSIEEIFAVSYLVYPKYFNTDSGKSIEFEDVLDLIKIEVNRPDCLATEKKIQIGTSESVNSFVFDDEKFINQNKNLDFNISGDFKVFCQVVQKLFDRIEYSEALGLLEKNKVFSEKPKFLLMRAQCLQKLGFFGREIDNCYIKAIENSAMNDRNNYVYLFFSYKWESEPLSEVVINRLKSYVSNNDHHDRTKSFGKIKLLLASFYAEVGQINQALRLRDEAKKLKAVDAHLMNLKYWAKRRGKPNAMKDYEYEGFKKLLSYKGSFKKMVLDASGDVCVVGNSPSLIGKGLGEEIDNHKLVIRFNSYDTSFPFCQDVGTKTDIWVRMPFHPYVKNSPEPSHKLIMFSGSNRYNRPYSDWVGLFELMDEGFPVEFFDPTTFYELQAKLSAPPTAGLMICYMLYKIIGPLDPKNYYGFSFLDEKTNEQSKYHYSDLTAKSSSRHNWIAESDVFRTIIKSSDSDTELVSLVLSNKDKSHPEPYESSSFIQRGADCDSYFCTSPGLKDYNLNESRMDYLSSKAIEDHNAFVTSSGKEGKFSLTIANAGPKSCFVGFGRARTGNAAITAAKLTGGHFKLIEYGFISSMHLPSEKQFNFSLVIDDVGIFYDTTKPSRIENILFESEDIFSDYNKERSRLIIDKICINNITKYNNSADLVLPESKFKKRILVVDQTENDNSILLGQCDNYNFSAMLETALKNHDTEVVLKLHPETIAGAKGGNLTEVEKHKKSDNLLVVDKQCNIISLIKQVDEVYVMTSGVGFEALMLNKPVTCFGVPFYAGWGLTKDMQKVNNPRRSITLEALFSAVFFNYTVFFHPVTEKQCSMEECVDWIIENKPTLPIIKMEK
ncbi:MAG: glycosyltransferase family 29 protein [Neptunomonas phycophila]